MLLIHATRASHASGATLDETPCGIVRTTKTPPDSSINPLRRLHNVVDITYLENKSAELLVEFSCYRKHESLAASSHSFSHPTVLAAALSFCASFLEGTMFIIGYRQYCASIVCADISPYVIGTLTFERGGTRHELYMTSSRNDM